MLKTIMVCVTTSGIALAAPSVISARATTDAAKHVVSALGAQSVETTPVPVPKIPVAGSPMSVRSAGADFPTPDSNAIGGNARSRNGTGEFYRYNYSTSQWDIWGYWSPAGWNYYYWPSPWNANYVQQIGDTSYAGMLYSCDGTANDTFVIEHAEWWYHTPGNWISMTRRPGSSGTAGGNYRTHGDTMWIWGVWGGSNPSQVSYFDKIYVGGGGPIDTTWYQSVNVNMSTGAIEFHGANPNGNNGTQGGSGYQIRNYPPYGGYFWEIAPGGYVRYDQIDLRGCSGADSVKPAWTVRGSHAGGAYTYVDVNSGRAHWDNPSPEDTTGWWNWSWSISPDAFNWGSDNNHIDVGNQSRAWATLCCNGIGCFFYGVPFNTGLAETPTPLRGGNKEFGLRPATPNPFSSRTAIGYMLSKEQNVDIAIFDASGRLVRTLVNGKNRAGSHSVAWDRNDDSGRRLPPSVYFCRLRAGDFRAVQKLIVQ